MRLCFLFNSLINFHHIHPQLRWVYAMKKTLLLVFIHGFKVSGFLCISYGDDVLGCLMHSHILGG